MSPRVSIGIPFYNPGASFELAVKSVFAQTFEDWELILLDDGSTDDSLRFARSLSDERVRVYSDGANKKLNARLNEIGRLARSPVLFRMDSDDIMRPDRVEVQYRELQKAGPNTVLGSSAYSIDDRSNIAGIRDSSQATDTGFGARHRFIHPTVCAYSDWFRQNPYNESFIFHRCQDAELWVRVSGRTQFKNLRDPLLFYRELNCFKFDNYLGSGFGLICMLVRNEELSFFKFGMLTLKELGKLWIVALLNRKGKSSLVVGGRYRPMDGAEKLSADNNLMKVMAKPLPIRA